MTRRLTASELEAGLDAIRASPRDAGALELIVRRPASDTRELLEEGELDPATGLVGDRWQMRAARSGRRPPSRGTQLTLMNVPTIALIAGDVSRWPLAGDQLFVNLDLSRENLPPGTQLAIGDAILEISEQAHTGCAKFVERFGLDAMKFVNSPTGRALNLRGIYAQVLRGGRIRRGDVVSRL
jgi:MOSC domain-containing protein YiiM